MASKRRKKTPAERFLDAANAALDADRVFFDEEHFGKGKRASLRGITVGDIVAVLRAADEADCEEALSEPGRTQEKWLVRGATLEGERRIVVVTIVNVGPALFIVTAHFETRGDA